MHKTLVIVAFDKCWHKGMPVYYYYHYYIIVTIIIMIVVTTFPYLVLKEKTGVGGRWIVSNNAVSDNTDKR